jgi:hypothetical protein
MTTMLIRGRLKFRWWFMKEAYAMGLKWFLHFIKVVLLFSTLVLHSHTFILGMHILYKNLESH